MKLSIQKIAKENFAKWNSLLKSKNYEEMSNLYTKDTAFLPTFSTKLEIGRKNTKKYFKHFMEKNPVGKITKEDIKELGKNCYLHSGMYDFTVGPKNKRTTTNARFSFLWIKNPERKWEIAHHHSSVKPL